MPAAASTTPAHAPFMALARPPHQPECCARIDSAARVREASCAGVYLRDSARSFSLHRPGRCSDQIILVLFLLLRTLPARRQCASADKLHVEAAKLYPLLDSPDPSKTQSVPSQWGQN